MYNSINTKYYQPTFTANRGVFVKKAVLCDYLEKGLDRLQIAEILKIKPENVDYMLKAYDLTPEGFARLKELENKVISLKNKRATDEQVAKEVGITLNAVKTIIKNLILRDPKMKGLSINRGISSIDSFEKVYEERQKRLNEKLKNYRKETRLKICNEIIDLYSKGFTVEEIAKKLKRSVANIKGYMKYIASGEQ